MAQTKKKKKFIALSLVLIVLIGSAFAYLAMQTGIINNKFTVGSSGAKLIEIFNGVTYEGQVDEDDDGFANAVMLPGNSYTKDLKVQFTGRGKAVAFLKIAVPNDTTFAAVDANGIKQNKETSVLSMKIKSGIEKASNQWVYIDAVEKDSVTEYIYGYNTVLSQDETTQTSLVCDFDVVNYYISNNEMPDDMKTEYLVPVTAYTVQYPDAESLLSTAGFDSQEKTLLKMWNDSNLSNAPAISNKPTTVQEKATVKIKITQAGTPVDSAVMTLSDGEELTWANVKAVVAAKGYDTDYAVYSGISRLPKVLTGGETYTMTVDVE